MKEKSAGGEISLNGKPSQQQSNSNSFMYEQADEDSDPFKSSKPTVMNTPPGGGLGSHSSVKT